MSLETTPQLNPFEETQKALADYLAAKGRNEKVYFDKVVDAFIAEASKFYRDSDMTITSLTPSDFFFQLGCNEKLANEIHAAVTIQLLGMFASPDRITPITVYSNTREAFRRIGVDPDAMS